jgi:beta-mannosidase
MIYHDMMYANNWMPTANPTQADAIIHNVRRLASHPSIVVWDGCNECYYYDPSSFVMPLIVGEDKSRPIWGRSPSQGWVSGVERLYGLPNDQKIILRDVNFKPAIELHGDPFYYIGSGWPTVAAGNKSDINCPNNFSPYGFPGINTPTGTNIQGVFTSEFGAVSMSSFESMTGTLDEKFWGVHTAPFYQRNWPVDNFIFEYFNKQDTNKTGAQFFMAQMYQSLIAHGIHLKGQIETHRSQNMFGTLVWQLNEIWPTGGFGMVEYGTASVRGQVLGGRWKPAMHFAKNSAFSDVICACGQYNNNANCYCKNDGITDVKGTVSVETVHFGTGAKRSVLNRQITLPGNQHKSEWFCLQTSGGSTQCQSFSAVLSSIGCDPTGVDCVLLITVTDSSDNTVLVNNVTPLTAIGNMKLQAVKISFAVSASNNGGANIKLTSDGFAVYVVLTTKAHGRFSDNAFMLFAADTTVSFIPFGALDMATLTSSLRVEHAQQYITPGATRICQN